MKYPVALIAIVTIAITVFPPPTLEARSAAQPPQPRALSVPEIQHVTFAAVGDSITTLEYLGEPRGELSWINHATNERTIHAGGWAQSGASSDIIAANVAPVAADVLVVMVGTNDVNYGADPQTSMLYIDSVVATVGIQTVLVSAIAPTFRHPVEATTFNAVLREHAAAMGWTFVDPWTNREPDGTPTPGTTYDELHPNGDQQDITGRILRAAIWELSD